MPIDKTLLAVVDDFASWRGNTYALAALLIAKHLEMVKEKLIENGFPEAADSL